jgi:hypothetical protein
MAMLGTLFLWTWILWDHTMLLRCEPAIQTTQGTIQSCMGTKPSTANKDWYYGEAFDTREACEAAQAQAEAQHPPAAFPVTGDLLKRPHDYACLPAGVHPKDTR